MDLLRSLTGRVLIEGHRGAEGIAPENSWEAIYAGYDAGADLLELDVQMAQDGSLVIYNNYQLPNGQWIRNLDKEQLISGLPVNRQLVFLDEVLSWVKDKSVGLSLDIKNGFGFDSTIFLKTLSLVIAHDLTEKVNFLSWDHVGLLLIKNEYPTLTTRALIRARPVNVVQVAQNAKVGAINLDADMVTNAEISQLHAAGIAVVVAELINPDILRAVKLGADVICCQDPKTARELIG